MAIKAHSIISDCIFLFIKVIENGLGIPKGVCRFYPSCSEYARDAIRKKSLLKAVVLIIWRVLRCNPLVKGGYDPVK